MSLLVPSTLFAESFSGLVVGVHDGVHDGDTLTVMHLGVGEKIRLNGIDAPEKSQDFGNRAKEFLSQNVYKKNVTIEVFGKDKYKRTIGVVILPEGTNVNQEMVKNGYAWWYEKYAPNDLSLKSLEEEARRDKRGLWSQSNPIPPWDFRHGSGNSVQPIATLSSGTLPIIGNKNSRIYHLPNCDSYGKVSPKNRIIFQSNLEAEGAGYRKARNCRN